MGCHQEEELRVFIHSYHSCHQVFLSLLEANLVFFKDVSIVNLKPAVPNNGALLRQCTSFSTWTYQLGGTTPMPSRPPSKS